METLEIVDHLIVYLQIVFKNYISNEYVKRGFCIK